MTIFISIASYCDPLLHFTVRRALDTARWPQAPCGALAELVDAWSPDLVVTIAGGFPEGLADGADILKVDRRNLLGRLADALLEFPFRHA